MALSLPNQIEPIDVSNSCYVHEALKNYLVKRNLSKLTDKCFRAFDAGYVTATCRHGNVDLFFFKRSEVTYKPLKLEATIYAFRAFDDYAMHKDRVSNRAKDCFVEGYLAAYYRWCIH